MRNVTIIDSSSQIYFARELEFIKAKSYDVQHQDLEARMHLPVSSEAPEGSATITYQTYDMIGAAKIINAYADDLPRADVYGKETTIPVRAIGSSFGYNRDEILQAQMAGKPLDQRRANAVQRAWEEVVDEIAWNGDAASGLLGFLNHPNVPTLASTTTSGWIAATADEIIKDVNTMVAQMVKTTRKKERPNTLLLPVDVELHISGTPRSPQSDVTIREMLLRIKYIDNIESINELTNEARLYNKNPDKLQLEIVKELEFLPPQERGLELIVPAFGKTGGTNIYFPISILKTTGV